MGYLLRSMLYVPAYNEKFINKALESDADALIIDLEDSVPEIYRPEARNILERYIQDGAFKNKFTIVRLNSIDSNMVSEDVKHALHEDIDGFMLSKIFTYEDLVYYDRLIDQLERERGIAEGHFKFVPLIETASAVMDIYRICSASGRNIAVCFGSNDYLNDIHGMIEKSDTSLDYPRALIAIAARAARILPIDAPYFKVKDEVGFRKLERNSFEMGYAGVQLMSPRQISWANECYTPTEDEILRAKAVMRAVNEAKKNGSGVVMLDNIMVGPPTVGQAENTIRLMELIKQEGK